MSEWQKSSLGSLGEIKTSSVDKKNNPNEKKVNLINYMDVYKNIYISNNIKLMQVTATSLEILKSEVMNGDILFTPSSETPDDIGHASVVIEDFNNTLHSYHTVRLRLYDHNLIDSKYLSWSLNSEHNRRQFSNKCAGSTRYTLSIPAFQSIVVKYPKLRHQQKIATILTTIDTAIEKTQELIDKYQKIKTGLMNDLFTRGIGADGKLRPPRSEAPELYKKTVLGWIPKEWGDIDIDGFCADIADCPHSTPNYIDSGYYCIRTADLEPGMLKLDNAYLVGEKDYQFRIQRLRPKENDIIYSREGERLGIAAPVGEETVCLGQRVMILRAQPYYSPQFLLWYMNYQPFYRDITTGLSATTSPHVNVGDIKVRRIPKPGKDEQFEIGRRIQGIQKRIEKELKYQSKLQKQKSGLMHDLLTGKVEVTVSDEDKGVAHV